MSQVDKDIVCAVALVAFVALTVRLLSSSVEVVAKWVEQRMFGVDDDDEG